MTGMHLQASSHCGSTLRLPGQAFIPCIRGQCNAIEGSAHPITFPTDQSGAAFLLDEGASVSTTTQSPSCRSVATMDGSSGFMALPALGTALPLPAGDMHQGLSDARQVQKQELIWNAW